MKDSARDDSEKTTAGNERGLVANARYPRLAVLAAKHVTLKPLLIVSCLYVNLFSSAL